MFDLLWFGIVVEMEEGRRHGERDNMGGEKGNKEREEGGGRGRERRGCVCVLHHSDVIFMVFGRLAFFFKLLAAVVPRLMLLFLFVDSHFAVFYHQ